MSTKLEALIERAVERSIKKALEDKLPKQFAPLLRDTEVAEMCACSVDWLRDMRYRGEGPPTIRRGVKYVRYPRDETLEWFLSHRVERR